MSRRPRLLGDISWLQLTASVLAAVTAAWIASRLGVAGTLIGAALGSFVVTISSALYGRTLDRTRTLLIQTESGTVIERRVEQGEVRAALDEAAEVDSAARGAAFVDDERPGLHWKTIIVTAIVVLSLTLAAISTYELITGRTLDGDSGTTIGDSLGGGRDRPSETPAPPPTTTTTTTTVPTISTPTASTPTPTPTPTASTPTPTPSETPE